jgi:hypothetical protein
MKSILVIFSLILSVTTVNVDQASAGTGQQVVSPLKNAPADLFRKYDASDVNNAMANALYSLYHKRLGSEVAA